ncbi:MAG: aspartate-semialdehyde dehydrogenase [Anaerolineaceae bacterium]|nr:aspartate-semialdehyde dehydrogenase [Anaerolineaceae bacterium]
MNKIPVAVLGATGIVGQRFVQMLADHPWFEIAALVGSKRSAGRKYGEAANWVIAGDPPEGIIDMTVLGLDDVIPGRIAFSALPSSVARETEPVFAEAGFAVCSNASAYRMEADVPVIIPEVNGDHIAMLEDQRKQRNWKGLIVTSPNCTTTGMVIAMKPLHAAFGIERVFATSFQAISGAGYPGVSFLDVNDNLIPYIKGEEDKMENESLLLLGKMENGIRVPAEMVISAQANRAPVLHGHTICLSMGFKNKPSPEEAIEVLKNYRGPEAAWNLPSAPERPVIVRMEPDRPQPRRDRDTENGMVATVGRVRTCPLLDLRLVSVIHNAIRGAAGGSVLNAELLVAGGYIQ